nr:SDR family NAD(P)-dependent oxidoreductase [uncultured Draconibacterium sp.]
MKQIKKVLVTGANGHLGNNLVKELVKSGYQVRAGVRNVNNLEPFKDVNCEIVHTDLEKKSSLLKAMQGIDILFQVAAVFKHWAVDVDKEILAPNINGTKNIIEAAAECKVDKVIYVSSIAALDHNVVPLTEEGWNTYFPNPYFESKQVSEKLALRMARELHLDLITVLPSAMIGKDCYHLTPTMDLLNKIIHNQIPFNPDFHFNYVDVKDVACGIILASNYGKSGNRYILATEDSVGTTKLFELAHKLFPDVTIPPLISKDDLLRMAEHMESESKTTQQAPFLTTKNVHNYYQADARIDISKSRQELGYNPRNTDEILIETLEFLKNR